MKVQGQLTWHRGAETDEFFLILDGHSPSRCDTAMSRSPRGSSSWSRVASSIVRADSQTAVLLFELSTVVNTGDARGELTADVEELT